MTTSTPLEDTILLQGMYRHLSVFHHVSEILLWKLPRLTVDRLNFQYFLWQQQVGYQLSPAIPVNKEYLKIADLGTGTG
jgi:hypothetical protein